MDLAGEFVRGTLAQTMLFIRDDEPADATAHKKKKKKLKNDKYGYVVLGISGAYLLFLVVFGRLMRWRAFKRPRSPFRKLLEPFEAANPLTHLVLILVATMIPFYTEYPLEKANASAYMRRLGKLSYVLATLDMFIVLRPNWLLGLDYVYTDFIPLHKWLSRVIILLATVHSVMYPIRWKRNSTAKLIAKAKKPTNVVGEFLAVALLILALVSAGLIRKKFYRTFYVLHNLFMLCFIIMTPVHALRGSYYPYFVLNMVILSLMAIFRVVYSKRASIIEKHSDYMNTNLVNIQLPRNVLPQHFTPASHLRVSPYRKINPLYWLLPSHPYTVASLDTDDVVDLIISERAVSQKIAFRFETGVEYTFVNQFDPAIPVDCIKNAQRVLIVCGGSGVTFGVPIFRYFQEVRPIDKLEFIWLIRDRSQLNIFKKMASIADLKDFSNFKVFITREMLDDDESNRENIGIVQESGSSSPGDIEIEMESYQDFDPEQDKKDWDNCSITYGRRLSWEDDIDEFVNENDEDVISETTWVIACGPHKLVKAAKMFSERKYTRFAAEFFDF